MAAEKAATRTRAVRSFERKRPSPKPFPEHLPHERVALAAPEDFVNDGRGCLTSRALRGFALGRKSWLFASSERGAERAAAVTTLIMTAKLNDVDPFAWLADVLARIADTAQSRLAELLPWNWTTQSARLAA